MIVKTWELNSAGGRTIEPTIVRIVSPTTQTKQAGIVALAGWEHEPEHMAGVQAAFGENGVPTICFSPFGTVRRDSPMTHTELPATPSGAPRNFPPRISERALNLKNIMNENRMRAAMAEHGVDTWLGWCASAPICLAEELEERTIDEEPTLPAIGIVVEGMVSNRQISDYGQAVAKHQEKVRKQKATGIMPGTKPLISLRAVAGPKKKGQIPKPSADRFNDIVQSRSVEAWVRLVEERKATIEGIFGLRDSAAPYVNIRWALKATGHADLVHRYPIQSELGHGFGMKLPHESVPAILTLREKIYQKRQQGQ